MKDYELTCELRTERTSKLIFWLAHPSGLIHDLKEGLLDAVKPSQAHERFQEVTDAVEEEVDHRLPAPMRSTTPPGDPWP